MILILTQCFPSRQGGIENLISNLALNLSKKNKVVVFADQQNFLYDSIYDNQHKDRIITKRFSGIKFFRKRKKAKEVKFFIKNNNIKLILADTWKSFELCIDFLKENKIKTICLAHGNEILHNNINKEKRIKKTINKTSLVIANSNFTADLLSSIIIDHNKIKVIYPGANDLRLIKSHKFFNLYGEPVILTLSINRSKV